MSITKLKPTKLYSEAKRRYEELSEASRELENRSTRYPEGMIHIRCCKNNRVQFFVRYNSEEKCGRYIRKNDKSKIGLLLMKKYDKEALNIIKAEMKLIEKILKNTPNMSQQLKNLFSSQEEEVKLYLDPVDISDRDFVNTWLEKTYKGKEIDNQVTTYKSDKGDIVRSKSELNIANMLYKLNIPYKYECPLVLRNGRTIYPDFTVLDIENRREIYWEHRGMMDDRDYSKHALQRTKDYRKSGIFLCDNLIITEESSLIPLGTDDIEEVIMHFFKSASC